MVIPEFFSPTSRSAELSPAPYLDRFFANVIDFLILVPVVSLFTSGINNDLRWAVFSQNTTETYLLVLQYAFVSFSLFLLYETLFIYFHQATPGHRFLYLKLISESNQPLSLFQILFRTVFKFQAIIAVFIPFIEIVIRQDRTTFYDRLSQTQIMTLKKYPADDVHPEFRKIIFRWVHTIVIMVFMVVGLAFYQSIKNTDEYNQSSLPKIEQDCNDSLAQYLKGYLSKTKESENLKCARIKVENEFESKTSNTKVIGSIESDKAFGYLAQYIVTPNDDLKESYKNKYCMDRPNRILCKQSGLIGNDKYTPDEEDVINLLVDLNSAVSKDSHARIFEILDVLYSHVDWNKNLELYYLTSFVFLSESKGRSPASEKINSTKWSAMKVRFLKRMSVSK